MARSFLSFFLVVCLLFSCTKLKGGHLPDKTMEKVLYDISLVEVYSINAHDNNHFLGSKNTDSLSKFYQQVFDHYHITRDEFNKSMNWYKSHPDDLDTLYGHILIRVGKDQAELAKHALPKVDTAKVVKPVADTVKKPVKPVMSKRDSLKARLHKSFTQPH